MDYGLFKTDRDFKRILWVTVISFFMLFLFLGLAGIIFAQGKYPSKPINFIHGYPAGGGTDIFLRPLLTAAGKTLGQPVVLLNKPGGGTAVALAGLKSEKPDGYTIGSLISGGVLSQHMRKVPYNTVKDFTPIIQCGDWLYGLVVRSDSPWKTFKEFIEYAKANPGKIRYSTAGPGTPQHLVMERLALEQKIKWTHIPFEGEPPALSALLGGHVEASSQAPGWKKYVQDGSMRLLAVYGEKRMQEFPEVPTLLDLGYNITAVGLACVIGPKGLSPQVVETLHNAFRKAMDDPDFIRVARQTDVPIVYRGPQDLGKHLEKMNEEVESLIQTLGLRKE